MAELLRGDVLSDDDIFNLDTGSALVWPEIVRDIVVGKFNGQSLILNAPESILKEEDPERREQRFDNLVRNTYQAITQRLKDATARVPGKTGKNWREYFDVRRAKAPVPSTSARFVIHRAYTLDESGNRVFVPIPEEFRTYIQTLRPRASRSRVGEDTFAGIRKPHRRRGADGAGAAGAAEAAG